MKIALIGSAPSSVRQGPYKDASFATFAASRPLLEQHQFPFVGEHWEIWGCSPGVYGVAERLTRWFELHRWEPGQPWFSPEYCDFLRKFKGLVYTGEVIPELPTSERLPREHIAATFSDYFLTSSLSFMMALAIMEIENARAQPGHDPKDDCIGLWGVDMSATEEYGYQRAGCQFFILEARRRGIDVVVPPESDLARPMPMYGVCEWSHAHIKLLQRKRELEARLGQARAQIQNSTNEQFFLQGALDDLNYMINTWAVSPSTTISQPSPEGQQVLHMFPEATADATP